MRKSWGLTSKILSGQKKIESRWYRNKYAPWGKIKAGEVVYFKDSGEPVTIRAQVEKVLQFTDLNKEKVGQILDEYGKDDGIDQGQLPYFYQLFQSKKYCLLIFLKNPQQISPFEINKTGYGAMAAWITIEDINTLKY